MLDCAERGASREGNVQGITMEASEGHEPEVGQAGCRCHPPRGGGGGVEPQGGRAEAMHAQEASRRGGKGRRGTREEGGGREREQKGRKESRRTQARGKPEARPARGAGEGRETKREGRQARKATEARELREGQVHTSVDLCMAAGAHRTEAVTTNTCRPQRKLTKRTVGRVLNRAREVPP